jgi:hypothetical protein
LEARRYRLMLLAALRGNLEPYYSRGAISIARENLILDAIDLESAADWAFKKLLLDQAFIQFVQPKNRSRLQTEIGHVCANIRRVAEMDIFAAEESHKNGSIEKSVEIFYALAKAGLVTAPD